MKKFAVIMITILVLFIFLMLNYLLWDKENLMKQNESDRIEQDWLRGQNRTLQATIEEQEETIKELELENSRLSARISSLEQEIDLLNQRVENYRKEIAEKSQAIENYKLLTKDLLLELTAEWFESISRRDYDGAWEFMMPDPMIFGSRCSKEDLKAIFSPVHSIRFAGNVGEREAAGLPFEILKNYGNVYEVTAVVEADVSIGEKREDGVSGWREGVNRIRMTFVFSPDEQRWAIKSVSKTVE